MAADIAAVTATVSARSAASAATVSTAPAAVEAILAAPRGADADNLNVSTIFPATAAAAAAAPTPISTLPGAPVGGTGIAAGQQAYEKLILEKGSQIIDCDVDFTSKRPYVSTDVGAKTYQDWVEQARHVEARRTPSRSGVG
jgi:hypothetical protein